MQVNETAADGLKREFRIVVPAGDIETKLMGRLSELGKSVNVPGFRRGKVPMGLLRKRYGEIVRGEVLEQTIQDATEKAMTEKGMRPALRPKVEIVTFDEGTDLEYTLAVEILPEIVPTDFAKISLERKVADIAEEEVDKSLQALAERRRSFAPAPADHEAAAGDRLKIDFVGRVDGEPFEGGSAEGFELEIGAGGFVPGFEEQLVGAKAGSKMEVKIAFPADYPMETLKGKDAVFDVEVKEISVQQPVTVDEDLAKALGAESLAALRTEVRDRLASEFAQVTRARLKRDLLDKLADSHDFEVPPGMVDQEFEAIWHQVEHAIAQDSLDEDDKGKSEEELKARYREIAVRRVRLGLLLAEVGRSNNITVGREDLNRALSEQLRRYPAQASQLYEFYQKNPEAMQELQAPIFEDKVIDFILELADIKERKVSVEELVREPEESGAHDHA